MVTTLQDGRTPLHLASERGHTSVVEVLIGAQADINLLDKVLRIFVNVCIGDCSARYAVFILVVSP